MSEDVAIVLLDDRERWEAEHRDTGLPSQSWTYAYALRASGIEPRLAIVRSNGARMLLPFFERSFKGTTDIATIPGLSGASIEASASAPVGLWHEYATEQGWICGYIQLALSVEFGHNLPYSDVVTHNQVFILDLDNPNILGTFSRNLRRKIRDAERCGIVLVDEPAPLAESVTRLHPALVGTGHFSPETLSRWTHDPACVGVGASIGDQIEAVHLYRVEREYAEGHLAATSKRGRNLGAWLICKAIERLQQRGVRRLNIGGGGHIGDGIYQFKQRFNVAPTPLRSLRQIYDRERYEHLCEGVGTLVLDPWFPPYRGKPSPAPEVPIRDTG
jgi:hypothetical protein